MVNETDALEKTALEVQAAAEREEKIQKLTDEAKAALQGIAALRKEKGSGRPPKTGPAGSELKSEWEHKQAYYTGRKFV